MHVSGITWRQVWKMSISICEECLDFFNETFSFFAIARGALLHLHPSATMADTIWRLFHQFWVCVCVMFWSGRKRVEVCLPLLHSIPTEIKHFWIKFAYSFSPHFFNFFFIFSIKRICVSSYRESYFRVLISNRERDTLIRIEEKSQSKLRIRDYWLDGTKYKHFITLTFGQKSAPPVISQICQIVNVN